MDNSLFDANGCITQEAYKKWNQMIAGNGVICDQKGGCAVGELVPTANNSSVTVATGAAVVDGIPYWADSATAHDLTPFLPSAGFCGFCIVLESDNTLNGGAGGVTQKILKSGSSLLPQLTQNSGGVWQMPIACGVVDSAGDIFTDASASTAGLVDRRDIVLCGKQRCDDVKPSQGQAAEITIAPGETETILSKTITEDRDCWTIISGGNIYGASGGTGTYAVRLIESGGGTRDADTGDVDDATFSANDNDSRWKLHDIGSFASGTTISVVLVNFRDIDINTQFGYLRCKGEDATAKC